MKKILLVLIVLISSFETVKACDICGCGVGSSYIGILPDFRARIFGIRYRYNSLWTHVGVGGSMTYLTSRENYRIAELWGGWNLGNHFRIMASVPYNFDERINQGNKATKNGLGDISVTGFYELLNSRKTVASDKLLVQSLWVGAGVKLPTGRYDPADKTNTAENTNLFQLGTGSVDVSLGAMYDIRLQDAGLNMTASYKMNTANKYDYNYGNRLSLSTQAYYKFKVRKVVTIAPNAGILYEKAQKDVDNGLSVDISGGRLLMGTVGVEAGFKKVSVGASWQTPLSQNLANGIVKARDRAMVHVSFQL